MNNMVENCLTNTRSCRQEEASAFIEVLVIDVEARLGSLLASAIVFVKQIDQLETFSNFRC